LLDSLLSTLKLRQLEAIKHTQCPQLILAGAGTGKTTTITARIAYMVEKENIEPSRILALTFSKEAARNMREKVEKLLQGKEIHIKTFHSFCAELIKDHSDRCKVPGDFKIFEEFEKQFSLSDNDIVSLDVSFRSTNKILRVAHTLIEKNYGEEKKQECQLLKNHKDIEGENVSIIETEVCPSG
jgi:superfamily I DNA/RNA helicase